jgi:hypothetical protein
MNYQRIYDLIIQKANQGDRKKYRGIYYEKHHILPICLGGNEDSINKVLLTAKEHFICHKLLTYIYPHHAGIALSFHRLAFDKNINRNASVRDYEYARELCKEAVSGKNNGMFGKKLSIEHISKLQQATNSYWTDERKMMESLIQKEAAKARKKVLQ